MSDINSHPYYYCIEIHSDDGIIDSPVFITTNDDDWQNQLNDAVNYFEQKYGNLSSIEVAGGRSLGDACINYHKTKPWGVYRQELFNFSGIDKVSRYLKKLNNLDVPAWIIHVSNEDLNFMGNEDTLRKKIMALPEGTDRELTLRALDITKKSHEGQTQVHKKDFLAGREGLDNIPYANHPIQIANMVFDLGLAAQAIQTALLHDVLEITSFSLDNLSSQGFSSDIIQAVNRLSHSKEETRKEFLERIVLLENEPRMIKCLDRYHNLIRSFSVQDIEYLNRYIDESREFYLPLFKNSRGKFAKYGLKFEKLINALENFKNKTRIV